MLPNKIQQLKNPSAETTRSHGFVLVVDDEEQNRTLLRDPLEARGYEVEEAENGRQALQKIALRPPDVILLDLMMPDMDGFEVCRQFEKRRKDDAPPDSDDNRALRTGGPAAGHSSWRKRLLEQAH